jgi:hypothetical protein
LPMTLSVRVSPTSWSETVMVPVTAGMSCVELLPALSAMAAGLVAAMIAGPSLVPVIVTVTIWLAVPSLETAVKESVIGWPALSCWIAVWLLLAV